VIVSVENGDKGFVTDANGLEVRRCLQADLETGECICQVLDKNGAIQLLGNEIATTKIKRPAPLKFERRTGS